MLSIIASVQRIHCRRILGGEKTVEIRKTRPYADDHFHIFLYETKADHGEGAVVGECECYQITDPMIELEYSILEGSCLTAAQLMNYTKGGVYYGWYLSHVVQYDQPRPLPDFGIERAPQSWCYLKNGLKDCDIKNYVESCDDCGFCKKEREP